MLIPKYSIGGISTGSSCFPKPILNELAQWLILETCRLKYIPRFFWVLPTLPGSYVEIFIYSSTGWGPTCFPKHLPWLCVAFSHGWCSNGAGDGGTVGSQGELHPSLWGMGEPHCIPLGCSGAPPFLTSWAQAQVGQEGRNVRGLCTLELK